MGILLVVGFSNPFTVAAQTGGAGSALQFDGNNDYVSLAPLDVVTAPGLSNRITIEVWIKPTSITAHQYYEIIRQQSTTGGSDPDWLLSFQDFGTVLAFGLSGATFYSEFDVPITATNFTDGNWHHIAAVYDATVSDQRLYVDGVLAGSTNKSGYLNPGSGHLAALGATYAGTGEFFQGQIDELRIWSDVRGSFEIRTNRFRRLVGNEAGLEAYYRFDEGTSTSTVDATGNGHSGTLKNGVTWINSSAPLGSLASATTSIPTLGPTNATLLATINPNGLTNQTWFEWGLTASYGNTTAKQTNSPGTNDIVISQLISNLPVNTVHHFRVISSNVLGLTIGSDVAFSPADLPTVTTTSPSLGNSNAVLSATVNPNGLTNYTWFQWGLTTNYDNTTPAKTNNPGINNIGVTQLISNLLPNTVYNFRAVSSNSLGTNVGANVAFSSVVPPGATTLTATNISANAATLNGSASANGGAIAVWFEWGISTAYGNITASQNFGASTNPISVSQVIGGLIGVTGYHYRIAVSNIAGITLGNDQSFTTTTGAPSVVTIAASSIGGTDATVAGNVMPNGLVTKAWFEWGPDNSLGFTTVANAQTLPFTNALNIASATLFNLVGAKTYYYRVCASNALAISLGNILTFTTLPAPAVSTGVATDLNDGRVVLNGQVNANGNSTVAWFEYGSTAAYGNVTQNQNVGNGGINVPVTDLRTDVVVSNSYHFRLVASNSFGVVYGVDRSFTVGGASPSVLTVAAINVGTTTATLTGAVNPNALSTVAVFELGPTTNYGMTLFAGPQGSGTNMLFVSYDVPYLVPGTTYHYRIKAINASATSVGSDAAFTTLGGPPLVTTLTASPVTANSATLRASVNPNLVATSCEFQWGLNTNYGNFTATQFLGGSNSPASISESLLNLNGGTTYHFRVVAHNLADTVFGADQSFTTPTASPFVITQPPTDVSTSSATMNGLVFPNGQSTRAWFEWGTNASLGRIVPLQAATAILFGSYSRQSISIPAINLTGSSNLTLEAWIKPSDITFYPNSPLIRQQPANYALPPDWLFAFQDEGHTLSFGVHTASQYQELDVPIPPGYFTDGNWHHIAAVYTGTNQLLYIDHALAGSTNLSGPLVFNGVDHSLGADPYMEEYFTGAIDDVRIWSSALNAATLDTWMDKPVNNSHPAYANLEGNWSFEEFSGRYAYDSSTHGRDGQYDRDPVRVQGVAGSTFFTQPTQFSSLLTGLNPGATYYYRMVGSNSLGVINGFITNFTTSPGLLISSAAFTGAGQQQFQIGFSTQSNQTFSILGSTNLVTWTNLGPALEASPGHYQFIDSNSFLYQQRFYQLQSP